MKAIGTILRQGSARRRALDPLPRPLAEAPLPVWLLAAGPAGAPGACTSTRTRREGVAAAGVRGRGTRGGGSMVKVRAAAGWAKHALHASLAGSSVQQH